MAIKFQYNKTSLQSLDKQLKMRVRALPTIKNKESALRSEVKKAKQVADEFNVKLEETLLHKKILKRKSIILKELKIFSPR